MKVIVYISSLMTFQEFLLLYVWLSLISVFCAPRGPSIMYREGSMKVWQFVTGEGQDHVTSPD